MAVNQSARPTRLTVGGLDFSKAITQFQPSDPPTDESGLRPCTGTLALRHVLGLPESLDDRLNPSRWRIGQTVVLETKDSASTWRRHPRGALRILAAEYDPTTTTLQVRLGCLLALLNYREPTDPDIAEIQVGQTIGRSSVVLNLLAAAGIISANVPALPYAFNYPIKVSGSYLSTMGKVLYDAGYFAWIDNQEVLQVGAIDLSPATPEFTVTLGSDECFYRRLSSPEAPREIIRAVGVVQDVEDIIYPKVTTTYQYGDGSAVSPGLTGYRIVLSKTTLTEDWEPASRTSTETLEKEVPAGLALGQVPAYTGQFYPLLAEREQKTGKYEPDAGRLVRQTISIEGLLPAVMGDYFNSLSAVNQFIQAGSFITSELQEEDYSYISDVPGVSAMTREPLGAILNDLGEDWATYGGIPTELQPSEQLTDTWVEQRQGVWRHSVDVLGTIAQINPKSLDENATLGEKLLPVSNGTRSKTQILNSAPPSPKRQPTTTKVEDRQVLGEARFAQYGSAFRERIRTYQLDYLGHDAPEQQCQQAALNEGRLLQSRFRGQEIGTPLVDELFDWQALMSMDVEEPTATRNFRLDAANWMMSPTQCLISFDGLWMGDRLPSGTVKKPWIEVLTTTEGLGLGATGNAIQPAFEILPPLQTIAGLGLGTRTVAMFARLCKQNCVIGFKVFSFAEGTYNFTLYVEPGVPIDTSRPIQVHRWTQEPNTNLQGRQWYANLPSSGGTFTFVSTEASHWISFFAVNTNTGKYDAGCVAYDIPVQSFYLSGF